MNADSASVPLWHEGNIWIFGDTEFVLATHANWAAACCEACYCLATFVLDL